MARMKMHKPKVAPPAWGELDIDAAFDACGSSMEELRDCVIACRRSARWVLDAQIDRNLTQRGYDARQLCARELSARVADTSVYDLLQTIALGHKDAIINVYHGSLESRIWCSGGEIIDAESGRLEGESAVHRILALESGELLADFRPVRRLRTIQSSTQALMLEAMRRKDERGVIERRLGGVQRVYASKPKARNAFAMDSLESALLQAFEGGARIETVLAGSALDDLTVLEIVWRLVERDCLAALDGAPRLVPSAAHPELKDTAQRTEPPSARAARRPRAWQVFAALLTFGIVGVLLAWEFGGPTEPEIAVHTTRMPAADATATTPETPRPMPKPDTVVESKRRSEAAAPALPPTGSAPTSARIATTTYPVEITVEPARAEIWLDGEPIARGRLCMVLERDGRTHELRISAADHRSQTFLFSDSSPPRAVILEPDVADDQPHEPRSGEATAPSDARPSRIVPHDPTNPTAKPRPRPSLESAR